MPFTKICPKCNRAFTAKRSEAKYCSRACRDLGRRTEQHAGYPTLCGKNLHRLTVEQAVGRKLESWEFVHHKDGNKENNALSNLQITTLAGHNTIHKTQHIGCLVPNCKSEHSSSGLCAKHREQARRKTLVKNLEKVSTLTNNMRAVLQEIESGTMAK